MKLRTLLLSSLLGLGALAPLNTAKADHYCERTRVTYDCHGCPTYWAYRMVDRDCHGCPIYSWVRTSPPVRHYEEDHRPRYSGSSYHSDRCSSSRSYSSGGDRGGFYFRIGR
jgi:hypothetical protein